MNWNKKPKWITAMPLLSANKNLFQLELDLVPIIFQQLLILKEKTIKIKNTIKTILGDLTYLNNFLSMP